MSCCGTNPANTNMFSNSIRFENIWVWFAKRFDETYYICIFVNSQICTEKVFSKRFVNMFPRL